MSERKRVWNLGLTTVGRVALTATCGGLTPASPPAGKAAALCWPTGDGQKGLRSCWLEMSRTFPKSEDCSPSSFSG